MVGHSYLLKIFLVTGEAIGRRAGEFQRCVALFAGCRRVTSVERKNRRRVIEIQRRLQFSP